MRGRDAARPTAALLVGAVVFTAVPAAAGWTDATSSAAMPVSSATMSPPTAASAGTVCVGTLVKLPRVTVSWSATPSAYATGYTILRLTGGSYVQVGTVAGRTTTTYVDSTVSVATTYTYKVRATFRNWYAETTGTASATTPVLCL